MTCISRLYTSLHSVQSIAVIFSSSRSYTKSTNKALSGRFRLVCTGNNFWTTIECLSKSKHQFRFFSLFTCSTWVWVNHWQHLDFSSQEAHWSFNASVKAFRDIFALLVFTIGRRVNRRQKFVLTIMLKQMKSTEPARGVALRIWPHKEGTGIELDFIQSHRNHDRKWTITLSGIHRDCCFWLLPSKGFVKFLSLLDNLHSNVFYGSCTFLVRPNPELLLSPARICFNSMVKSSFDVRVAQCPSKHQWNENVYERWKDSPYLRLL